MENKKYLIVPGYVISKMDGNKHYIPADNLIRLYQVDRNECHIWKDERKKPRPEDFKGLIFLYPRYDGDYPNIPEIRCHECRNGIGYINKSCEPEYLISVEQSGFHKCPDFKPTLKSAARSTYSVLFGWL